MTTGAHGKGMQYSSHSVLTKGENVITLPHSMDKLSSTKPVPSAKRVGTAGLKEADDICGRAQKEDGGLWVPL